MLIDYKFMNSLIMLINLARAKSDPAQSGLAEQLLTYQPEIKAFLAKFMGIEEDLSIENVNGILSNSVNVDCLRRFFLDLITSRPNKISKKIESIRSFLQLNEQEAKLFQYLHLMFQSTEKIYFDHYFEKKFNYQQHLSYFISHSFDLPQDFVHDQLFNPTSNLSKYRLIVYHDSSLRDSFYIRRFLTNINDESFEDYLFKAPVDEIPDFPFTSEILSEIANVSEIYKKNPSYKTLLMAHSSCLSLNLAKKIEVQSGLKLLYLDLSPESKNVDLHKQGLSNLWHQSLENHLVYINLSYQMERFTHATAVVTMLENLLENKNLRIILATDSSGESTAWMKELFSRVDRVINAIDSDKETRKIIYSKVLNGGELEDKYYRVPMLNSRLERFYGLRLEKEDLERMIVFFNSPESTIDLTSKFLNVNFEFFNTDIPALGIREAVSRFIDLDQESKKLIERTAFLLSGPPGTGKSLLAESICLDLGLSYRKVRLSDFSSPYIHETERKTRNFFKENSAYQVLIFDEFDSLALKRENSQRHYEVTEVNEFLNCMDEYKGVIFATTNHVELIDPAAIRRFDFKVHFDYLKPEAALSMFYSLFGNHKFTLSEKKLIQEKIKTYKQLTPAILKNIHRQSLLLEDMDIDSIINRMDNYLRGSREAIRLLRHEC